MAQDQIQKLISELQNGTAQQRRAASYKLRNFKDPIVVQVLINAYTDLDASVRQNTTNALRLIGTKDAQDFLVAHQQSLQVPKSMESEDLLWILFGVPFGIMIGIIIGSFIGLSLHPVILARSAIFVLFMFPIIEAVFGIIGGLVVGLITKKSWGAVIGGIMLPAINGAFIEFWYHQFLIVF